MANWYMTVGYPGGGFAARVETMDDFPQMPAIATAVDNNREFERPPAFVVYLCPCPPDLAEWLDAVPDRWHDIREGTQRMKVPGGWLYVSYEPPCKEGDLFPTTFVPVAGAAGITILEDTNGG